MATLIRRPLPPPPQPNILRTHPSNFNLLQKSNSKYLNYKLIIFFNSKFSLCFDKFLFSLSRKMDFQIPCFRCAVATLSDITTTAHNEQILLTKLLVVNGIQCTYLSCSIISGFPVGCDGLLLSFLSLVSWPTGCCWPLP